MADMIKRPWYGTVLGVLNYIGIAVLVFSAVAFLFAMESMVDISEGVGAIFQVLITIFFLLFAVLAFFLGRGFYKGQKWAVIVTLVMLIIDWLTDIGVILGLELIWNPMILGGFVLTSLALWATVMCLKHPFYNQKKVQSRPKDPNAPVAI